MYCVYENHAGCERGYFRTSAALIALPKKDKAASTLSSDVVLYDDKHNVVFLVEGKKLSTLKTDLGNSIL